MKKIFSRDYFNYNQKKIFKLRKKIFSTKNKILRAIRVHKYSKLCYKNNAFIPLNAEIGNVIFPHGVSGIFISSNAKIGDGCVIFQEVTIGSNNLHDSKKRGAPIIGDNCYIGAGAKIIGKVTCGNNVRIGANCTITSDISDNCTVVMGKCRIIKHSVKKNNQFIEME